MVGLAKRASRRPRAHSGGGSVSIPRKAAQRRDHRGVARAGSRRSSAAISELRRPINSSTDARVMESARAGVLEASHAANRDARPSSWRPAPDSARRGATGTSRGGGGAHQIPAHILDRAHQTTESLSCTLGTNAKPAPPPPSSPRQTDRVTSIGLTRSPEPSASTRVPPRARRALDHMPPGQADPGRAGLIHRAHRRPEALENETTSTGSTAARPQPPRRCPGRVPPRAVRRACTSRPTRRIAFTDMVGSSYAVVAAARVRVVRQ